MSEGVNSAEDVLGGRAYGIGILDDIAEGVAQRLVAKIEEAESVGVVIDGGFGLDAETVHDDFGAAPLQEGLVDFVAASVFADLAAEAVMGEVYLVAFCESWRGGGESSDF